MNKSKKGFTLAELLIVVAIIAVLVAIAIPIFTTQLEKSREATDLANVRSAYAELMTAVITEDKSSDYYDKHILQNGERYIVSVALKQKKDDWQGKKDLTVAGVSSSDTQHWLGYPKVNGQCMITYDMTSGELFINWNGTNIATNLDFQEGCWNATGEKNKQTGKMISTYNTGESKLPGLYELEGGTEYKVSFTYDPHFDNPDNPTKGIIARATLIYDSTGKSVVDTRSGSYIPDKDNKDLTGITYRYTKNSDGTITYTATFKTPGKDPYYYYGMNFGGRKISPTGATSGDLYFTSDLGMTNAQVEDYKNQVKNSFIIEKVK